MKPIDQSRRGVVAGLLAAAGTAGLAFGQEAPAPIFDAHFHIIDPRFPLVQNQGYLPPWFTLEQYRAATRPLGVSGGAVVAGSFQGFDQSYMRAALKALGPGWVGVTQLAPDTPDTEILSLAEAGVRAVRFNVFRGHIDGVDDILAFAGRVFEVAGWHAEIYADAAALAPHVGKLSKLPRLAIDHLGMTRAGLPVVLDLADAGVHIKATGFGRVDFDVPAALAAIAGRNADALMFGTDLPSTRAPRAFQPTDIALLRAALPGELGRKALRTNALAVYQPRA